MNPNCLVCSKTQEKEERGYIYIYIYKFVLYKSTELIALEKKTLGFIKLNKHRKNQAHSHKFSFINRLTSVYYKKNFYHI